MYKVTEGQSVANALRVHTIDHAQNPRRIPKYQISGNDVFENAASGMYLLIEPAHVANNTVQAGKLVLFQKDQDPGSGTNNTWSLAETAQPIPVDMTGPIGGLYMRVDK